MLQETGQAELQSTAAGASPSIVHSNGNAESSAAVHVVVSDSLDPSPVVEAARGVGAEVRLFRSVDEWFSHLKALPTGGTGDLAVLLGSGSTLVDREYLSKASSFTRGMDLLAAIADASVANAADLVKQGANGLLCMLSGPERLQRDLEWYCKAAVAQRPHRLMTEQHRQNLAKLTQAENDVLESMLEGLANKQIAQRLGISLRTVELRRSKIMRKMEATNLAQLVHSIYIARN